MLRKGISLLLAIIIIMLSMAAPALAKDETMPEYLPVALDVFSDRFGEEELEGLYKEQVLYFPADTICHLTGASLTSSTAERAAFSMHGGLRQFTVDADGQVVETFTNQQIKSEIHATTHEGELYISAWEILSYMGAVVEFGQDDKADVHLSVYMPYTVLDLCADALREDVYRFNWSEADGKLFDPEDVLGLAALDTILIGYESNIFSYINGSYADHVEKDLYSDVLMEILYCNEAEEVAAAHLFAGVSEATSSAVSLPLPWLQQVMDLTANTDTDKLISSAFGTYLDVGSGLIDMNASIINTVSTINQYCAMSNTLQNLLRNTLCRVKAGDEIYQQYPLLFDTAHDIDAVIQDEYAQKNAVMLESLYGLSNIGASLMSGNIVSTVWSTLTDVLSLDYDIEGSLLNDEKRITFASVCSDVGILAYQLLGKDAQALDAANFNFGKKDTQLQEYVRMDIILCLKSSLAARELLLKTGWLTDSAQMIMELKVEDSANLLNQAENAAAVPIGIIKALDRDISWIENLHLLDGLSVVHPLFRLQKGFVKRIKQQTEVPAGYIPIYSFEDFKVIADHCSSKSSVTSSRVPLNKHNQAKYILMNDITMPDKYDSAAVFAGVLDGNGYTMKNVSMPLFGRLYNATVKNLAMEVNCTYTDNGNHAYYGGYASDDYYFGFISHNYYYGKGTENYIDNCSITGSVNLTAKHIQYGSIVGGRGNATITNCYSNVDVNIRTNYAYVGGIGCFGNTVDNCINAGNITVTVADNRANSIAGIGARYNDTISTCYNSGDIHVSFAAEAEGQVGGIVGLQDAYSDGTPNVYNCYNIGNIIIARGPENSSATQRYAGGIVGFNQSPTPDIKYCWNGGRVEGAIAGGIIGHPGMGAIIEDCSNLGDVAGIQSAGGIVGTTLWLSELRRCVNAGSLSGGNTGNLVGEHTIVSSTQQQMTIQDCYTVRNSLPIANPPVDGSSVTTLDIKAMSDPENMDKLDFEKLWIIRSHLPIPLLHDPVDVIRANERVFNDLDWDVSSSRNVAGVSSTPMDNAGLDSAGVSQPSQPEPTNAANLQPEDRAPEGSESTIAPLNFQMVSMTRGKNYSVYSAASTKAWRGAKGKASVSTNGDVWAAGWENGWLLIYYETSKGSVRVGYIDGSKISGNVKVENELIFAHTPARITEKTAMTDDIARAASSITTLKAGTEVTYLTAYYGDQNWAYIETKYEKKTVRGFVPLDSLELLDDQ